ncbi:hypothetical protein OHD16_13715 [Sphingobacterium sp. ML3W]|uniref:hypothetical protein n=1 Tax=Sphingobacterium sp. ML3W TaxID=1538644 RepID=UPI00249AB3D1|nr:hypothetical protein [Sphingobacterium sp. ML3W]WFA81016.1 hypothetical protein OGI71_06860 [Sphingobacterium sp. ML3W]
MKKIMMSLVALVILSSAASAKTTENASHKNATVKTSTYRLPKTNTIAKVTEEATEMKNGLTRCRFVLTLLSYDDLSVVGTIVSETYTNGSCGDFFRACRANAGV